MKISTLVLLILIGFDFSFQYYPLIETPNGRILGHEAVTTENKNYYAFQQIPYAKPPIGELRFQPPKVPEKWDGVLNATRNNLYCYTLRRPTPPMQSEDCLYLNVFTPQLPTNGNDTLLAVMLYIHGGGFSFNSGADALPDLFINHDVVLVSINYRLGVFGFISTQDQVIPGNNGLKDQQMAIEWTYENIQFFGGDPSKITIFGQSAGAGSCAYHLLNKNSASLLYGVILQSGTFLCTGMFQRNSREIAFGVGAYLNSTFHDSEDSQALYEFLSSLEADDLNNAAIQHRQDILNIWDNFLEVGTVFAPVIEPENPNVFLSDKMYNLLKSGEIGVVPTMMGFCKEEKSGRARDDLVSIVQILDENLDFVAPADMKISDLESRREMGEKIRNIYTKGESFTDHLGAATRFASDNFLSRSMIKHAELFSSIASTYFYQFSYHTTSFSDTGYGEGAGTVNHTAELPFIFCTGDNCKQSKYSPEDLTTRERLLELWTNFAKYQNPTPKESSLLQSVTWPKISTEGGDFFYLDIGIDLQVLNHPKNETYQRWIELYESLGRDDFDTY